MANTLEKALWLLLHESYLMSHQVQKTRLRPKYSNMCNRRNVLKAAMIFGNSILNQSKIFLAVLLQFFDFKPSWYTTLQLCNKYKDRVYQDIICSFEKSDNSQKNDTFFKRMYNTISESVQYICQYFKFYLSFCKIFNLGRYEKSTQSRFVFADDPVEIHTKITFYT